MIYRNWYNIYLLEDFLASINFLHDRQLTRTNDTVHTNATETLIVATFNILLSADDLPISEYCSDEL